MNELKKFCFKNLNLIDKYECDDGGAYVFETDNNVWIELVLFFNNYDVDTMKLEITTSLKSAKEVWKNEV